MRWVKWVRMMVRVVCEGRWEVTEIGSPVLGRGEKRGDSEKK